jgi:hypothetical protein
MTLVSCEHVDLSAVQGFASAVASAAPAFTAVSSDVYQHCVRIREYLSPTRLAGLGGDKRYGFAQYPLEAPPPTLPPAPFEPTPVSSPARGEPIPSSTPPPPTPPGYDPDCALAQSNGATWTQLDDFIIAYGKALGQLAGANVSPTSLPGTVQSLEKVKILKNDALTQYATAVAAAILDAVLAHQRDRDILAVVREAENDKIDAGFFVPLQDADKQYYQQLGAEQVALNGYYLALLSNENAHLLQMRAAAGIDPVDPDYPGSRVAPGIVPSGVPSGVPEKDPCVQPRSCANLVAIDQLRERMRKQRAAWSATDQELLAHFAAAVAYDRVIGDVRTIHAKIAQSSSPTYVGLYDELKPYFEDFSSALSTLQKSTATASSAPASTAKPTKSTKP